MEEKEIIEKIIQIRNYQKITKRAMAEMIGISESNYGRIESYKVALSYSHLVKIANAFNMSIIDVIAYPDKYIKLEQSENEPIEAVLQIRLKKDQKDQVLKLVFGDNNIEILNK